MAGIQDPKQERGHREASACAQRRAEEAHAPAEGAAARTHACHQPLATTEQPPPARVDAESDWLTATADESAKDAAAPIDARAHAARQCAAADGVAAPAEGSGAAGAAHAHDGHEQSRAEEDVAAAAHGDDLCRLIIREE